MTNQLRVAMAQLNLTVGDIDGNYAKHLAAASHARDTLKADVIVFPELSITGYPPEDLLLRQQFIDDAIIALNKLTQEVKDIYCLVGHPQLGESGLHNACSLLFNGKIVGQYFKQALPNYGVFDEKRYFTPGTKAAVVKIKDILVGLCICEDIWVKEPVAQAVAEKAQLILAPNASPFEFDKYERRLGVLSARATENNVAIVYVNQIGGQDEVVFDGGSMVLNADGQVAQSAGFFEENIMAVDVALKDNQAVIAAQPISLPTEHEKIYNTLVLGLRDYVRKNGFKTVILGLSGGIDSALTLAIAVDAIGKENVFTVSMPSRYTADISNQDAVLIAKNLGVHNDIIPIEPIYAQLLQTLAPHFAGKARDITEENLQARCRANILMALSNKFGHLVLTTGNRSEIAVGYCTLYGDMAGGYGVLKDIPKMLVYALSKYRNTISPVIPERTISRAPSAELSEGQKDEDSLPPYPILDKILYAYINEGKSIAEIAQLGIDEAIVKKIVRMIYRNEYKRKQAAMGPRIYQKSFGKDWRYPVTHGFKG